MTAMPIMALSAFTMVPLSRTRLGLSLFIPEQLRQDVNNLRDTHVLRLSCRTVEHLNFALGNLLAADVDAERDSHQIGILELDAGPLVAVVEQHVVARLLKF